MDTHPPGLFQIDGNLDAANGCWRRWRSRVGPDRVELDLLPAAACVGGGVGARCAVRGGVS